MLILSRAALLLWFFAGAEAVTALSADLPSVQERIDLNAAGYEELQEIHGIGPALAGRIMEMRASCYFYPLSSLIKVRGIGEATLVKIKDEGRAFVNPPPGAENTVLCQGPDKTAEEREQDGFEEKETGIREIRRIDINVASAEELQGVTGVGEVFAQRIIEARPFSSLDELAKVSGIGPKTLEKIEAQGLAWVDPKLEPTKTKEETGLPEKGLASIADPLKNPNRVPDKESPRPLSVSLTALALAIFSGIMTLILKNKLKNTPRAD